MVSADTFEMFGDGIGAAATVLRANAGAVPLSTPVPTCPGWTVLDLLAHQGMVHRWAAATIRGEDAGDGSDAEAEGRACADILDWFDAGATALLQALADAPVDLDVPFFLRNAPAPREAWARRQCHETTIHAVDAMAARLGRPPLGGQTWVTAPLAADGVDELILGFLPRRRSRLRSPSPLTIAVRATDTDAAWTIDVSDEPPRARRGAPSHHPDATFAGTATDLYLGLWNRADGPSVEGDAAALTLWHTTMRVSW